MTKHAAAKSSARRSRKPTVIDRKPRREVPANEPPWAAAPCDCGAGRRGHTCPPHGEAR